MRSKRKVYAKPEQKLTTNCRYFPSRNYLHDDVPVMCTETEKLFTNKCKTCGWNPLVKAERLRKQCGDKQADNAVKYSESITSGTNAEYTKNWKDYKPKKGEPEDV